MVEGLGEEGSNIGLRVRESEGEDTFSLVLLGFEKDAGGGVQQYYVALYDSQFHGGVNPARDLFIAGFDFDRKLPPMVGEFTAKYHVSNSAGIVFHYATIHRAPTSRRSYREYVKALAERIEKDRQSTGAPHLSEGEIEKMADNISGRLIEEQREGHFDKEGFSLMPFGRINDSLAQVNIPRATLKRLYDGLCAKGDEKPRPLYQLVQELFSRHDLRNYAPTRLELVLEEHKDRPFVRTTW